MRITKNIFKNFPKGRYLEILPAFKEEKTQAFTMLVLTLVSLSFFGFFAINPTLSTIAQLKKQLSDSILVDKKLEEKINNLGILRQKYAALENDIPTALSAVPQTPNTPFLIGQVQAVAQTSNLNITKVQSFQVELNKPKEALENYSSFAFSLEGQGSNYKDISDFLSSIVNFDRIVTVDVLSIDNRSEKDGMLKVSLRGKAYFKK